MRNSRPYNLRWWVFIIAAVVLLGSIAYSKYTESQIGNIAYDDSLSGLDEVVTPKLDDAQLLEYPGFKVLYSNDHRQPYFTSWILTGEHAKSRAVDRANNFRPDPRAKKPSQLADYRRSGYDRGHMAPSADFRYALEPQESTFFLTNISPQASELNTRAWERLEEQCRTWAKRDSVIVIIAGPILSDRLSHTIGNGVTVPERFFKVVLAPYANPPRAIGFIMPNSKVQGGVQATVVTVDQVEAITGYDFFSALPDDIEEQVESKAVYHHWQY